MNDRIFVDRIASPGTLITITFSLNHVSVSYPPFVENDYHSFEEGELLMVVRWSAHRDMHRSSLLFAIECKSGRLMRVKFDEGSYFWNTLSVVK